MKNPGTRQAPKNMHIQFAGPPPVGTVFILKGYEYEITAVAPHTRKDGGETNIVTWSGSCIECGVEFDQTTGRSFTSFKRRCDECRADFMIERDKRLGPA